MEPIRAFSNTIDLINDVEQETTVPPRNLLLKLFTNRTTLAALLTTTVLTTPLMALPSMCAGGVNILSPEHQYLCNASREHYPALIAMTALHISIVTLAGASAALSYLYPSQNNSHQEIVTKRLNTLITEWGHHPSETEMFITFLNAEWSNLKAYIYPEELADKQLNLLQQMNDNLGLRKNQFAWAKVALKLRSLITGWTCHIDKQEMFSAYLQAEWIGLEAKTPDALAQKQQDLLQKQLDLLEQMESDLTLRESQLAWSKVADQLNSLIITWGGPSDETATFSNYLITDWKAKAHTNPDAFAKKMLELLWKMDKSPTLRRMQFAFAKVNQQLWLLIPRWGGHSNETAVYTKYLNVTWNNPKARNNPDAFAEQQLNELWHMDNDPGFRQRRFSWAKVLIQLATLAESWDTNPGDVNTFGSHLSAEFNRAQGNFDVVAERQLSVIQRMDGDPMFRRRQLAHAKVENMLTMSILQWGGINREIALFITYLHNQWESEAAINNPDAFAEVQLSLLQQMNRDPEIRQRQFSFVQMALRLAEMDMGTERADR